MARGAASPSTTSRKASMLGHSCAIGSTPLLGRPGTVLPVTVAECELLLATGSTGLLDVRDAVLTTGVVPSTVTVICSVAVFFFTDTATTEIYTLSLHDALPVSASSP